MFTKGPKLHRLSIAVAFGAVVAFAACSGSGNPTAVYPAGPGGSTVAGTGSYQLPTTNGLNSTISVSGTGTLSVGSSASAPSVGAIPQAKQRAQTGSSNSGLIYYTITATSALTIKSVSVSVGFSSPPTASVYLAYWNGTEWVANSSPGSYTAGAVSLTLPSSAFPISLTAGQSLYLVAYEGQQIGTPVPPAPAVSPSALTISEGTSQTVTVMSKPGFTITAASSNTGIVAVSPTSAPVPAPSTGTLGSVTFTLTATYVAGSATVSFTDSIGQTTKVQITTNNNYPSPVPAPSAVTLSLGDTVNATIVTQPNSTVTASSSNTAVATVPRSEQANGTGNVAFTVTAVAAGTATITFTDAFANTGTMVVTVSGVKNGAFANGMTSWTNCSYAHTALTAAVNESTPTPVVPFPTQSPGAATAAVPTASLTGLSAQVTPPPNDNPSPPAGVTSPAPSVLGPYVALIGTINALTVPSPKGEFGICQQIVVPASPSLNLSFWEWEGNTEYTFKDADEDAVILDSTGTTVQQTLFVENHCYADPNIGQAPGQATSSGCWPAAYGGDSGDFKDWIGGGFWTQRGPYSLSAYAGQTITLYLGNWSFFANAASKYANFIYVGNVQLIPSATFPTVTTSQSHRTITMTLKRP